MRIPVLAVALGVLVNGCAGAINEAPLQASARTDHPYEVFFPEREEFGKAASLRAAPMPHDRNVIAEHFTVPLPAGWTVVFDKPSAKFVQTARLANAVDNPTVTFTVSETAPQPSNFNFDKIEKAKRHAGVHTERGKTGTFDYLHIGDPESFTRMATNDYTYIVINAVGPADTAKQTTALLDSIDLH